MCNRSSNGKEQFIDFGASLDFYGAILFCIDCGKELLAVLEYIPVAEVNDLHDMYERSQMELAATRAQVERLEDALDSVLYVRPDLHNDRTAFLLDPPNDEGSDDNSDEDSDESDRKSDETESGFAESTTE